MMKPRLLGGDRGLALLLEGLEGLVGVGLLLARALDSTREVLLDHLEHVDHAAALLLLPGVGPIEPGVLLEQHSVTPVRHPGGGGGAGVVLLQDLDGLLHSGLALLGVGDGLLVLLLLRGPQICRRLQIILQILNLLLQIHDLHLALRLDGLVLQDIRAHHPDLSDHMVLGVGGLADLRVAPPLLGGLLRGLLQQTVDEGLDEALDLLERVGAELQGQLGEGLAP
mmetsp:Transcript_70811/g.188925  ORF Transcript_70811/g.188925 Transcript_70811/m.188925 type:complete len:225 (+) Transcript_70811:289-963(+)